MVLFTKDLSFDDDGRAEIDQNFVNALYNAKMTVTANDTNYQLNPVSDALLLGSGSYVGYDSAGTNFNVTIHFDMFRKQKLKSIIFSAGVINQTQSLSAYSYKIEGSNDDSSWTDIDTASGAYTGGTNLFIDLAGGGIIYRYVRFYVSHTMTASASSSGTELYLMQAYV